MQFSTPIVIFIYKRTTNYKVIMDVMRGIGPSKIYIVADGAKTGDDNACSEARLKLESMINWDCDVQKNYSIVNMGLKNRFSSGIDWVFKLEDRAIFIEDDCVPKPDFFKFANEMLIKYKRDESVMSINGTSNGGSFPYSYDFSKYAQCWGWATWARAWKRYDLNLSSFSQKSWEQTASNLGLSHVVKTYWYYVLKLVKSEWIDTWDYQWSYAHFMNRGLAIVPSTNLVTNVGFDEYATNTKTKSRVANMDTRAMKWPLTYPPKIAENNSVSVAIEKNFYMSPIAIIGLLRQFVLRGWRKYANRH
jgi:hypothetical protein